MKWQFGRGSWVPCGLRLHRELPVRVAQVVNDAFSGCTVYLHNYTALLQRAYTGGRREGQSANTWSFLYNNGPAFTATASLSAPFQWRGLRALNVPLSSCCSKISHVRCRLWVCNHHVHRKPQHNCGLAPLLCAQKNGSQVPTQEAPEPRDSQRARVLPTASQGRIARYHCLRSTTTPSTQEPLLSPLFSSPTASLDFS